MQQREMGRKLWRNSLLPWLQLHRPQLSHRPLWHSKSWLKRPTTNRLIIKLQKWHWAILLPHSQGLGPWRGTAPSQVRGENSCWAFCGSRGSPDRTSNELKVGQHLVLVRGLLSLRGPLIFVFKNHPFYSRLQKGVSRLLSMQKCASPV